MVNRLGDWGQLGEARDGSEPRILGAFDSFGGTSCDDLANLLVCFDSAQSRLRGSVSLFLCLSTNPLHSIQNRSTAPVGDTRPGNVRDDFEPSIAP